MTRWVRGAGLLVVAVLQAAGPHSGGGTTSSTESALATAAALGQVVLLLRVRTRPLPVAAAVAGLYAVQVGAVDVVPPAACLVALWCVASSAPDPRRAVRDTGSVAALVLLVLAAGEAAHPGSGAAPLFAGITVTLGLAALLRRSERSRIEAVRAEGASAERLRIAADLHDLAGHGLGVVAVQSSTARMALDAGDQDAARRALGAVEASSRSALKEMRQLLTVLRGPDDPDGAPLPGLADVADLVARLADGGVAVSAHVTTEPVPPALQLTTYRVVQEALTNAVKHAPGSAVSVDVRTAAGALQVDVVSTGTAAPMVGGGTGLDGIRARVTAVGGTVQAGPTADGWAVRAVLPLEEP